MQVLLENNLTFNVSFVHNNTILNKDRWFQFVQIIILFVKDVWMLTYLKMINKNVLIVEKKFQNNQ